MCECVIYGSRKCVVTNGFERFAEGRGKQSPLPLRKGVVTIETAHHSGVGVINIFTDAYCRATSFAYRWATIHAQNVTHLLIGKRGSQVSPGRRVCSLLRCAETAASHGRRTRAERKKPVSPMYTARLKFMVSSGLLFFFSFTVVSGAVALHGKALETRRRFVRSDKSPTTVRCAGAQNVLCERTAANYCGRRVAKLVGRRSEITVRRRSIATASARTKTMRATDTNYN